MRDRIRAASPGLGIVFAVVTLATLFLRMWPPALAFEEPLLAGQDPWSIFTPWNGQLSVLGRATLVATHAFGDAGPLLSRVVAAAIIGAVAAYLASADWAIPSRPVRLVTALAFVVVPTTYPDAYVGPLNDQWWLAMLVLLIALAPAKRWHWPVIALAGLSGIAPCVALPLFRDRRILALAVPTALQLIFIVVSGRHAADRLPEREFYWLAAALVVTMAGASLPWRTRIAVLYLGLAILGLGAFAEGWGERYFTVAWLGIILGVVSFSDRILRRPSPLAR